MTDILENYGIDSESDVSLIDQDDFSEMVSLAFKPFHVIVVCFIDTQKSVWSNLIGHTT